MKGSDRRTEAACPCVAAREPLDTPALAVAPDGRVLALVRLHGHPLGLATATGAAGASAGLRRALVCSTPRRELPQRPLARLPRPPIDGTHQLRS
jgi:hypothetical protein